MGLGMMGDMGVQGMQGGVHPAAMHPALAPMAQMMMGAGFMQSQMPTQTQMGPTGMSMAPPGSQPQQAPVQASENDQ